MIDNLVIARTMLSKNVPFEVLENGFFFSSQILQGLFPAAKGDLRLFLFQGGEFPELQIPPLALVLDLGL